MKEFKSIGYFVFQSTSLTWAIYTMVVNRWYLLMVPYLIFYAWLEISAKRRRDEINKNLEEIQS